MPIMRISDPTFEEKRSDNRVFVRFRVNRAPEQSWINTFKSHASTSVLRAANAIFSGNDVTLELVRPKSRAELTTALDCFIEALRALSFVRNGSLAYQECATGHTCGPVIPYAPDFAIHPSYQPVGLLRAFDATFATGRGARASRPPPAWSRHADHAGQ